MGLIQPIGTLDRTISKTAIIKLANDHANQIVEGGNYDLLKTYVEMKRYELYIKTIINKLKTSSTYQARVMREEDQRLAPLPGQEIPADAELMTNLPALTPLDGDSDYADQHAIIRQNTIQYASASVQITKRITYDFTQDAEWNRLTDEIAALKAELKKREEYLKKQADTPAVTSESIAVRL
ncbi:MAG: hypothetical protein JWP57_778 [Spirosoma sp.]|nr:hypothetical protein [Spirosoma sp.]